MTMLRPFAMEPFEIAVALALLAVVVFQVWLTWKVARSKLYDRKQKIWQAQLIWLVPILGAGLVFSVHRDDDRDERRVASQLKR